jgi:photosystem II stability/assembly factor-like uncharacterized protein
MLDESNGWGIGTGAILRTVDGGLSWHDMSPPSLTSFGISTTADFLDTQHAWLVVPNLDDPLTGILYRTSDGGREWKESPVPFGDGSLRFLDARLGWMMATLGAGAGSMAVAIYRTEDGGASWVQAYSNDPTLTGAGNSLPLGGLKDGITPISTREAWIGGVVYKPGTIYLYQTGDGGSSWTASPVAAPKGYEQAELETVGPWFVNSKVAFLPVHISSSNGVMLVVYVSRDGGGSWLASPGFIPQGGAIDFVNETTGFVWNGNQFFTTRDSAQTWAAITPDVDFTDSYAGMDFVDAKNGFVLSNPGTGRTYLYRTSDSGSTWDVVAN